MEPYLRATRHGEVPLEMCLGCGGVWLDGAQVAKVHPSLDRLPASSDPGLSRPLLACPRCAELPVGFRFFDVELDHCPSCHGVWVDGEEVAALAATGDRLDGRAHEAPTRGYRDSAADLARTKTVRCRGCDVRLALEAATLTQTGPRCEACAKAAQEAALDRELEHYEVPKEPLFTLPKLEGLSSLLAVAVGWNDDAER